MRGDVAARPRPPTPARLAACAGLQYSPSRHERTSQKVPMSWMPQAQPSKQEPEEPEPLPSVDGVLGDKTLKWRYDRLLEAGFTESQAVMLALARTEVDLHEAVALAKKAGAPLAYTILS